MADWIVYDAEAAAATLPPTLATAFGAWLGTLELRMARLSLIVDGVVADFRKAVAADADATGSLDSGSLPFSCLRHAANIVWYTLAQECGGDADAYRVGWQDSEIYLRRLYTDLAAAGLSGVVGTPAYAPGPASGTVGGGAINTVGTMQYIDGYLVDSGDDGGGTINYGGGMP